MERLFSYAVMLVLGLGVCGCSNLRALLPHDDADKGVDADVADAVTEETLDGAVNFVKSLAGRTGSIIAVTGAIDLVANAEKCFVIRNGRPEMGKITGAGCQLSGMMTAFLVANPDNQLEAAAAAVCAMGLAGEIGWGNMQEGDGNSTYRNRIIDAVFNMNGSLLDRGAKYEIR
jgi:hydroxyethylthiazole kinase